MYILIPALFHFFFFFHNVHADHEITLMLTYVQVFMRKPFNSAAASKITPSLVFAAATVCRVWWIKSTSAGIALVGDQRLKHRRSILDTAAPSISMFAARQQPIVKWKHSACAKAPKWYMSPNDSAIKGLNSRQACDVTPLNNGDSVALHRELCKLVFCLFFPPALQLVWHQQKRNCHSNIKKKKHEWSCKVFICYRLLSLITKEHCLSWLS